MGPSHLGHFIDGRTYGKSREGEARAKADFFSGERGNLRYVNMALQNRRRTLASFSRGKQKAILRRRGRALNDAGRGNEKGGN